MKTVTDKIGISKQKVEIYYMDMDNIRNYTPNTDKMYTYLNAYLKGAKMSESLKALSYARCKHEGQTRKDGKPYISHPLSMACYAAALGIRDDNIMATILLHDVCEDCGVEIDALPFNNYIKQGVKHVTVIKFDTDTSKVETKRRYFRELLDSKEACITKAIDRYNNLTDMPFALSDDAIGKNAAETEVLLLPILKEAKNMWCEMSDLLFILRTNIRSVNDILKLKYQDSYEKWYRIYRD